MASQVEVVYRLTFAVPGRPKGKGRPRFVDGRVVTPRDTRQYERAVRVNCNYAKLYWRRDHVIDWPLDGLFKLKVVAYFKDNKSRPDITNVLKAVEDGLNGMGYSDDRDVAIVWGEIRVDPKEDERVEIELERLDRPHFTIRKRKGKPGARAIRKPKTVLDGGF